MFQTAQRSVAGRYLALWVPAFRLERCGFSDDERVALIAEERNAPRLVALTTSCRSVGLTRGMSASEARAMVPDVVLVPLDVDGEAEDRSALRTALEALSDKVAWQGEDTLIVDATFTAVAFGGEEAQVQAAIDLLDRLGHRGSVALADDPVAAEALARCGVEGVTPAGTSAATLARLPLAALRPERALAEALAAVGVDTIGAFADLDRGAVAGRYGDAGVELHRIANGESRPQGAVDFQATDPVPEIATDLAGATTTLEIHFVLPGVLAQLAAALSERDLAVVHLRLMLRPERGSPVAIDVRFGRPTRDPAVLLRQLRARMEGLTLTSPVAAVGLIAAEVAPERGWQPGLTDRTEATEPLPDLLARLRDRLGDDAIFGIAPNDDAMPERAWTRFAWPLPPPRRAARPVDDPVAIQQAREIDAAPSRPLLLLPEPPPIGVRCGADGRPIELEVDGRTFPVVRAQGPERISGAWWEVGGGYERDLWVIEADGRGWWIYRSHGRWFHHGWWD